MKNFLFALTDSSFDVPKTELGQGSLDTVLQIVFGIAAALAFLMVVISGLKYIISRGEPGEVAKAKNSILYALIGLVIAGAAFSIVTFVVDNI